MKVAIVSFLAGVLFMAVLNLFRPLDDTVNPDGTRSGMRPRVDHLTGCQYLSDPNGGITPRMTSDGKHLGCKQ